jgi:hypothetical protein
LRVVGDNELLSLGEFSLLEVIFMEESDDIEFEFVDDDDGFLLNRTQLYLKMGL